MKRKPEKDSFPKKADSHIPLSIPCLSGNEKKYVVECIETNWISSVGRFVDQFERKFASYVGSPYSLAVVNGTAALHLSLRISGIGKDDEVFVPSATFIATVNAIRYVGAHPVFVDINSVNLGMSPEEILHFIDQHCDYANEHLVNTLTGRKIKCVLPVHLYGHACQIDKLLEIAGQYNLKLIEDAAQGVGCTYKGKHIGTFGDLGCFSFNGNKTLTTGGGGMVITRDKDAAKRIKHLSNQARCDNSLHAHDDIGHNYRMMNIQAAIGVAQLEHIDTMIGRKREVYKIFKDQLSFVSDVEVFEAPPDSDSSYWMCLLSIPVEIYKDFLKHMDQNDIQVRPFWDLTHQMPMYNSYPHTTMTNSSKLATTFVCIPCHQQLTGDDIDRIVSAIKAYFQPTRDKRLQRSE